MLFTVAPALLTLRPLDCGFRLYDGADRWDFDFQSLGSYSARGSLFDYSVRPCGLDLDACRPVTCAANNASDCQPYDQLLPQRGVAVQYGIHAPAPLPPQQRCFVEGTSPPAEAPCTRACNVLAPAMPSHSNASIMSAPVSSWSLDGWGVGKFNSARARLSFAPQVPAWFRVPTNGSDWSAPRKMGCTDAHGNSTRRVHVAFVCDPGAASPRLVPPPSDLSCEVNLTLHSAQACFRFEWQTGPWGGCDYNHLLRQRSVECRYAILTTSPSNYSPTQRVEVFTPHLSPRLVSTTQSSPFRLHVRD